MSVVDVVGELSPPGIKNKVYGKTEYDKAQVVYKFVFFWGGGGAGGRGVCAGGSKPPDSNPFLLGFLPYPFSFARY